MFNEPQRYFWLKRARKGKILYLEPKNLNLTNEVNFDQNA